MQKVELTEIANDLTTKLNNSINIDLKFQYLIADIIEFFHAVENPTEKHKLIIEKFDKIIALRNKNTIEVTTELKLASHILDNLKNK